MYQFSDSDSRDSDEGIRFKTDSIRNKKSEKLRHADKNSRRLDSRRSRSKSPRRDSSRYSRSRHEDKRSSKPRRNRQNSAASSSENEHRESTKTKSRDANEKKDYKRSTQEDGRIKDERRNSPSTKNTSEEGVLGPALPSHLQKKINGQEPVIGLASSSSRLKEEAHLLGTSDISEDSQDSKDDSAFGPALPPHLLQKFPELSSSIGPVLPPQLELKENQDIQVSYTKEQSCIGPILPSYLHEKEQSAEENRTESPCIGPTLPSHLRLEDKGKQTILDPTICSQDTEKSKCIGPTLPPHLRQKIVEESINTKDNMEQEVSEDEEYGPMPEGHANYSRARLALEERALQIKMDQLGPNEDKEYVREEWMLELPAAKAANFGLGPRQFRSKAGPDLSDRSSWTDTPEDKVKKKEGKDEPKVDLKKAAELREIRKRDKEQESISKKHKKHKDSLLDIHRKKLKNEKKDESGPSERRPFSRDVDLQVNRFDEAQKKAVLKKAQLLDDRFSKGQSKFL